MQLMLTPEQLDAIRKMAEPVAIPVLMWSYKRLKLKLNGMITDNSNRIRDELTAHFNKRMDDHERVETENLLKIERLIASKLHGAKP